MKIFVCYSEIDGSDFARAIYNHLTEDGHLVLIKSQSINSGTGLESVC